jgi:hypothetical protein
MELKSKSEGVIITGQNRKNKWKYEIVHYCKMEA